MNQQEDYQAGEIRIFITAGEASGDSLAAGLMRQLREQVHPVPIRFEGVGGELMEREGLRPIFPMKDLSVMGIMEILPKLATVVRRIRQTARHVTERCYDAVVTVDAPDFSFRVARIIRKKLSRPPLMLHYVAPSVWAWRPERASAMSALYDGVLCLFPFEPSWFQKAGLEAWFTGHPVFESGHEEADRHSLRCSLGIPEGTRVIGALFGSRHGELKRVGPTLRDALIDLSDRYPGARIVALTLPHLEREVGKLLQDVPLRSHIISDQSLKWDAFASMDAAMATSGTVGLELAVAGVPHVIAYNMNPLSWAFVKSKLTVHYAHLVNILLDRWVVEEHIQEHCHPVPVARSLEKLLDDEKSCETQRSYFRRATALLRNDDSAGNPSAQAAAHLLNLVAERRPVRIGVRDIRVQTKADALGAHDLGFQPRPR